MGVNVCNGYDTREGVPSKTSNFYNHYYNCKQPANEL